MQDKDILKRAQELLDENSQPSPPNPNITGSYEEETSFSQDKSLEVKENLERQEPLHEIFRTSKTGVSKISEIQEAEIYKDYGRIGYHRCIDYIDVNADAIHSTTVVR